MSICWSGSKEVETGRKAQGYGRGIHVLAGVLSAKRKSTIDNPRSFAYNISEPIKSTRGTSPMTVQQPTIWQGAKA